jgi:hypothetical protein
MTGPPHLAPRRPVVAAVGVGVLKGPGFAVIRSSMGETTVLEWAVSGCSGFAWSQCRCRSGVVKPSIGEPGAEVLLTRIIHREGWEASLPCRRGRGNRYSSS